MAGILCEHCTGVCCRYIALPIDKPESRSDFDDIRWYLLHEGISVFVEDGVWHLYVETTCRHLQPDHRCGIYSTRPRICREYSSDGCDYHSGDYGWEHHFTLPEHLDEYCREHPPARSNGRRNGNGRGPAGRPRLRAHLRSGRKRRKPAPERPQTDLRGVPLPILRDSV